ncbi:TPA: hypothetical protein ACQ39K_004985, partial [Yersinia enterocolitica]
PGTYIGTLTGTQAGIATLIPQVDGSAAVQTAVTLTLTAVEITGARTAGHTFAADAGFPKTGFSKASFEILINGDINAYDISASESWVKASPDGRVELSSDGEAGRPITITLASKHGGPALTYQFTLAQWFIMGNDNVTHDEANEFCKALNGKIPSPTAINGAHTSRDGWFVGYVFHEWGSVAVEDFSFFWTNEISMGKDSEWWFIRVWPKEKTGPFSQFTMDTIGDKRRALCIL